MTSLNPFATLELKMPEREHEQVRRFTGTFRDERGNPVDIDRAPFKRYVDLWWAGVSVGVAMGRRSPESETRKFIEGVVFNQDPWRIMQLQLLALAETGDEAILQEPGEIIRIANEYAATGIPSLVDSMTGEITPIWAVTAHLKELANRL